jgi:hypothetical protein
MVAGTSCLNAIAGSACACATAILVSRIKEADVLMANQGKRLSATGIAERHPLDGVL